MFVRKSLFYDLNQHNRGDEPDFGKVRALGTTSTDAAFTKPKPEVKDPSFEDLLVANATVAGYVANRFVLCLT